MADATEAKGASARPGSVSEPYRSYNFQIEIPGVGQGYFTNCSEIEMRVEAINYREGGTQQIVRRLQGRVEHGEITLRGGVSDSEDLFTWLMNIAKGTIDRRTVNIIVLDTDGVAEKMRWQLADAWPCAWRAKPLDALGRDIYIQELTLVYESITRS
jgi:phage tail-like protein